MGVVDQIMAKQHAAAVRQLISSEEEFAKRVYQRDAIQAGVANPAELLDFAYAMPKIKGQGAAAGVKKQSGPKAQLVAPRVARSAAGGQYVTPEVKDSVENLPFHPWGGLGGYDAWGYPLRPVEVLVPVKVLNEQKAAEKKAANEAAAENSKQEAAAGPRAAQAAQGQAPANTTTEQQRMMQYPAYYFPEAYRSGHPWGNYGYHAGYHGYPYNAKFSNLFQKLTVGKGEADATDNDEIVDAVAKGQLGHPYSYYGGGWPGYPWAGGWPYMGDQKPHNHRSWLTKRHMGNFPFMHPYAHNYGYPGYGPYGVANQLATADKNGDGMIGEDELADFVEPRGSAPADPAAATILSPSHKRYLMSEALLADKTRKRIF